MSALKGARIPLISLPQCRSFVWVGSYIDRHLARVCIPPVYLFYVCVCVNSLSDGSGLFVADRCSLLTRPWVWWKERLLVEIPPFATRRLCWSTLLRVIAHNVTSIDWTDGKRQPERREYFPRSDCLLPRSALQLAAFVSGKFSQRRVCTARHDMLDLGLLFSLCQRSHERS